MDWIAVVLVLVGATLIARKRKIGWLINSAGNLLFVVYFYGKEEWPAFKVGLFGTDYALFMEATKEYEQIIGGLGWY